MEYQFMKKVKTIEDLQDIFATKTQIYRLEETVYSRWFIHEDKTEANIENLRFAMENEELYFDVETVNL